MVEGPPEMKEWLKNSPPNRECKREGLASEWLCTEFNDDNEVASYKRFKRDYWQNK